MIGERRVRDPDHLQQSMICAIIGIDMSSLISLNQVVTMPKSEMKNKSIVKPTPAWQEWAKKRAQNAPSIERVHEISKKVKVNVTQLLLEERRGE